MRITGPRSTRPWQRYLTQDERKRLAEIDKAIKEHRGHVTKLRAERNAIQNRATKRTEK